MYENLRSEKVTPPLLGMGSGDGFVVWEQKNIMSANVLHTIPARCRWAANEIGSSSGSLCVLIWKMKGLDPVIPEVPFWSQQCELKKSFKQFRRSQNKRKVGRKYAFSKFYVFMSYSVEQSWTEGSCYRMWFLADVQQSTNPMVSKRKGGALRILSVPLKWNYWHIFYFNHKS